MLATNMRRLIYRRIYSFKQTNKKQNAQKRTQQQTNKQKQNMKLISCVLRYFWLIKLIFNMFKARLHIEEAFYRSKYI